MVLDSASKHSLINHQLANRFSSRGRSPVALGQQPTYKFSNAIRSGSSSSGTGGRFSSTLVNSNRLLSSVALSSILGTSDADGSVATASDWGTSTGWFRRNDSIGGGDANDYIRFTLNRRSDLNLVLYNMRGADADLQLLNAWGNEISSSRNGGSIRGGTATTGAINTSDAINTTLDAGTYYIKINGFSTQTNYTLDFLTQTPNSADWYGRSFVDLGVRNWARTVGSDGWLSRDDMMLILRSTSDYGSVHTSELQGLRTLVNTSNTASNPLRMQDDVKVLSSKVVNPHVANGRSGIGNLWGGINTGEGSSAVQLENLIGKWFLGTDRPTIAAGNRYTQAGGSLFGADNSIRVEDISQGSLANCYVLAGFGAAARSNATAIRTMFTDNGDGTYTVRFFNNGTADYVTVDRFLPTDASGGFTYANQGLGKAVSDASNRLWSALAEKAYAQMNEAGWLGRGGGKDGINSYDSLAYGNAGKVMNQVANRPTRWNGLPVSLPFFSTSTLNQLFISSIGNALNAGKMITFSSKNVDSSKKSSLLWNVVSNHEYVMTGFNSLSRTVHLFNPWGVNNSKDSGFIDLTLSQLRDSFSGYTTA